MLGIGDSLKAFLGLTVAVLAAIGIGIAAVSAHPTQRGSSGLPVSSSTPGFNITNPKSEVVTISTEYRIGRVLQGESLTRMATTLGTPHLSEQSLTSESISFLPSGERSVTCNPQGLVINGVASQPSGYSDGVPNGRWSATKFTGSFPGPRSAAGAPTELQLFKGSALGVVATLGHATIGGIPTTEYRATISRIKLLGFGSPGTQALLSFAYLAATTMAEQQPAVLILSTPMEIWVDARGNALQVSASANGQASSEQSGSTVAATGPRSRTATTTVTMTLSDFGIPVRPGTPPKDVRSAPPRLLPTIATGRVFVRDSNGRMRSERGALMLPTTLQYASGYGHGMARSELVAVDSSGHYSSNVPPTSYVHGSYVRIDATFYPDATTDLACGVRSADHFVAGRRQPT